MLVTRNHFNYVLLEPWLLRKRKMFLWQVFLCSLLLFVTTGSVSVVKVGEGLVRKGKQAAKTWLYQKSNQHRAQRRKSTLLSKGHSFSQGLNCCYQKHKKHGLQGFRFQRDCCETFLLPVLSTTKTWKCQGNVLLEAKPIFRRRETSGGKKF